MKNIGYYLLLFLIIIPFCLNAKYHYDETIFLSLPTSQTDQWKIGYQKADNEGSSATRYIPAMETLQNWTQLLNIQFRDRKQLTSNDALQAMQQEAALNTGVTYKILSHNPTDLIFEKTFPTGEHEIVRMVMTKKGLHRVAYVKKGEISEAERAQWLDRLSHGVIGGKTA